MPVLRRRVGNSSGEIDGVSAEQRELAEAHQRHHPEDVAELAEIPERIGGHDHRGHES